MRTVIKAFLIVGIVGASIYALLGLCTLLFGGWFLLLIATAGIIICSLALKNLDKYGTGLAVVTLIFGSLISGILMLVYKSTRDVKEKNPNGEKLESLHKMEVYNELEKNLINDLSPENKEQLKELDRLYVTTLMTKDEYEAKKKAIVYGIDK